MSQSIENRQRIIFVSNAKESYGNSVDSIQNLSAEFPNVVFFTDDYDVKLNPSNPHRVNIWKAGQKYIKVHGVDTTRASVMINKEILTLSLSPNGLLSLSIGSSINSIIMLGAVPLNAVWKNNDVPQNLFLKNSFTFGEDVVEQNSILDRIQPLALGERAFKDGNNFYLSSNVNQIRLLLAIQPAKRKNESVGEYDGLNPVLLINNANTISDQDDAISPSFANYSVQGIRVDDRSYNIEGEFKKSLGKIIGLPETSNTSISDILYYDTSEIASLVNPEENDEYKPYEIYYFDIDISKSVKGNIISFFPSLITADDITCQYKAKPTEDFENRTRDKISTNSIYFTPFFNILKFELNNYENNIANGGNYNGTAKIIPYIGNLRETASRCSDNSYRNEFGKYLDGNHNVVAKVKIKYQDREANTQIQDYETVREEFKKRYNEVFSPLVDGDENDFIIKPMADDPFTYDIQIPPFIKDVLGAEDLLIYVDTENNSSTNINAPYSNRYLSSEYIYSCGFTVHISDIEYSIPIFVTREEITFDNACSVLQGYLNNNTHGHLIKVANFADLTTSVDTSEPGRRIELADYSLDSAMPGGYVWMGIPKKFMSTNTNETNLIISNGITYKVEIIQNKTPIIQNAHFALTPERNTSLKLKYLSIEYDIVKVKTPITGAILLLNNNDTKIYRA